MSDGGAAATLGAQVPVPTWAILLVTMALGPGDTLAASFIAAPEAAHLAAQVADLSDTVAQPHTRPRARRGLFRVEHGGRGGPYGLDDTPRSRDRGTRGGNI